MFQEARQLSTSTGCRLFLTTVKAAEIILNVGIIISLLGFKFNIFKAISRAAVPLETVAANFLPNNFANFFSKLIIYSPDEETQPSLTTL